MESAPDGPPVSLPSDADDPYAARCLDHFTCFTCFTCFETRVAAPVLVEDFFAFFADGAFGEIFFFAAI